MTNRRFAVSTDTFVTGWVGPPCFRALAAAGIIPLTRLATEGLATSSARVRDEAGR